MTARGPANRPARPGRAGTIARCWTRRTRQSSAGAAMAQIASLTRTTSETDISLTLSLDGTGQAEISTGIGFLDHMLTALTRHGLFDLTVHAKGDLHIDFHHTTEDVGIVLGRAFAQALGDKRGIRRFGHALIPMDEALAEAAVDLSGRPFLAWNVDFQRPKIGEMDTELFEELFRAFAMTGLLTLHLTRRAGHNATTWPNPASRPPRAPCAMAVEPDPRAGDAIPSTKGAL